ncbi:hypothetical protein [Roseomonas indoligenes]|uniref:Peptidase M41 domain-containing protein n=1 Tax=Roseomonas indoligenes TaxID=2820811 RepID=A0A940N3H0_9PROT|nr:hypothetical protein [Pararoseomonas indoligenes]MBP0496538.1 hypothetical protein [Pararoseomonas indoligenes]
MRLDVCVHEAGHTVVGWRLFGVPPSWVSVHMGPPLQAQCLFAVDPPRSLREAQQHAIYSAGGRAAVLEAKGRGFLPASTNPDAGYCEPYGEGCDAYWVHELERRFGVRLENHAKARALEIAEQDWSVIQRIAEFLATGMPLYSDYLDLILNTRMAAASPRA